jgi:hypothetical protein
MNPQKKLTTEQQAEERLQTVGQQQTSESIQEFATPEEMLRQDAGQTVVPPSVSQRLQESIAQQPPADQPWWKRWFRA